MKSQIEARELAIAANHGGSYGECVGQGTRWKLHPRQYDTLPIRTSTLPVNDNNFPVFVSSTCPQSTVEFRTIMVYCI
jgi:hypothetical protein